MKNIYYFIAIFILFIATEIIRCQSNLAGASQRTSNVVVSKNDTKEINSELPNNSNIEIDVEVYNELFPVISKLLSEGDSNFNIPGLVHWKIKNSNSDSIQLSIISDIPEWTSPVITSLRLGPGEVKDLSQTPFGKKLLTNESTIPTTILLSVNFEGSCIFNETRKLKVRPSDDMIWSLQIPWDCSKLIAAWVTPKDDYVEWILTQAKEKLYNRTLAGYNSSDLLKEIKAIFNAVRNAKVSYVNSTVNFGEVGSTQRVRLPKESIIQKSANCIDGAVLFASLFENIGLEPLIILIPGHAIIGVRTSPNSNEAFFIETTMVGRNIMQSILTLESTFKAALNEGSRVYAEALQRDPNSVIIIDIKKARSEGIYPLW